MQIERMFYNRRTGWERMLFGRITTLRRNFLSRGIILFPIYGREITFTGFQSLRNESE